MVILSVDYGERYAGLAITDPDGKIALRHSVVDQKKKPVVPVIAGLVAQAGARKVLVGVPLSLSGEETEQTHVCLSFIESLREALPETVEVVGVDETLTSIEAERQIKYEGVNSEDAHAEAARLMLSDYLKEPLE
jgi:putative holliday junction resolvase